MDINITLFGEMLTFAVLVWAMMKYAWPPIMEMIEERQKKIADGLEAAERGQHQLELAKDNVAKQLLEAKKQAATILGEANSKAISHIEEGKNIAQEERAKILAQAKLNIEQELNRTRHELEHHIVDLVIATSEKVLEKKIDKDTQKNLINKLIANI